MFARTHIAFGVLIFLFSIKYLSISNNVLFLCAIIFFCIFADIDYYDSVIGRKTKPFSYIINFIFQHRGILHSLFIPVILYFIFLFIDKDLAMGSFIGYSSHLLLDAVNHAGIMPFYPLFKFKVKGFFKSGGIFDWFLFVIFVLMIILILIKYI